MVETAAPQGPYGAPDPYGNSPRRRRKRHTGRRVVIVLLVLLAILLVVDRVGVYAAEVAAGNTLKESQQLRDRPDVDIDGFPFLTQLAAGDFDRITVTARDVPLGTEQLTVAVDRVRVRLDRITVSRDFRTVHAATADARATLGYGNLGDALDARIRYVGDGRIRATKSVTLLGRTFSPTVTLTPRLDGGVLAFGVGQVTGAGSLGQQVAQLVKRVFGVRLPLQGLPFELRVRSLAADSDGIQVHLTGADLTYRRMSP